MSSLDQYLWVAVMGGIMGFAYGFLIGANDVANAFASSVSSKSITVKQAVLIASVCEFSGAFLLGASVTSTVRSKIVDPDDYEDMPEVLMFGMFTSLFAAVTMLFIATHFGMPVSTTHDIVGSIMGFGIAAKGFDSIDWEVSTKIFISWIVSPLFSGAVAFFIFISVKYGCMKSKNPFQRAYWTFPIVIFIGIGIDLFYVLYKATSNLSKFKDKLSVSWVLPVSFGTGFLCGLVWLFIVGPICKQRVEARRATRDEQVANTEHNTELNGGGKDLADSGEEYAADWEEEEVKPKDNEETSFGSSVIAPKVATAAVAVAAVKPEEPEVGGFSGMYKKFADNTYNQDLAEQSMHENVRAAELWDQGEKFDQDAEDMFTYLQVFTACLNSFAHGANDVANTIAPLSAIIQIYQEGEVSSKSEVPKWILAYGGLAIVIGLLLYGYKVMKTLGYKLTMLSPSRGFSAELAASLVVVTASFNEIPVSTTQCIVGAVSGVGLVGGVKNVQWLMLLKIMFSWGILFVAASVFSALVFMFAAFSPTLAKEPNGYGSD